MKRTILFLCILMMSGSVASAVAPVKSNRLGTEDISVMSFEIDKPARDREENRWEDRLRAVVEMVNDETPAVLALQECMAEQKEDLDRLLPDYVSFGWGVHDGRLGGPMNAVYYRRDCLKLERSGCFWYSETPDRPKTRFACAQQNCCATWAVFTLVSSGRRFFLVNTLLDYKSEEARALQGRMILEKIDEYGKGLPAVVVGDFHAKSGGTFGKDMTNPTVILATRMIDARRMSLCTSNEPSVNFYGRKKAATTDFIFYTPDLEGLMFRTVTARYADVEYMSDHYPVRSVLRFRK